MNSASPAAAFADLGLPDDLVAALARGGIDHAFPIQAATIEHALAGRDVLGKARTGSGKTLAFGLPALARLSQQGRPAPHQPHAIVMVPTRELAMQVSDALEPYAHALHVSLRLVAGGLSMSKQIASLERGVHLVVATPGRLADLMRRGHADLSACSLVVLDEADHMADMGFMPEITEIMNQVPAGGQRLLFSATLDGDVDRLARDYMSDPVLHDVTGGEDEGPSTMSHLVLNVPPHAKYQIATRIAAREGRTLVFVRTKLGCDRIAEQMREAGITAVALHGDKSQAERNAAITGFRAGSIPVLVATDVAARGIHVDSVNLVLQLDPPTDHKDYTHRAGRTARAGMEGLVVTLVLPHQRRSVDALLGRADVKPLFRKLSGDDAASHATVQELTGGREPSGIPVPEPRMPRSARGGPRGRADRPHRPARGGYEGHRSEAPRDDRGGARARDEVARKERELQARERELEMREQQLTEREQAAQPAPPQRTAPPSRTSAPTRQSASRRESAPRSSNKRDSSPRRESAAPQGRKPRTPKGDKRAAAGDSNTTADRDSTRAPSTGTQPSTGTSSRQGKGAGKPAAKGKKGPKTSSRSGKPRPKKKR